MIWEKVARAHVSGPWSIRRYGYLFRLSHNGKPVGLYPSIAAAKLAVEGGLKPPGNVRESPQG